MKAYAAAEKHEKPRAITVTDWIESEGEVEGMESANLPEKPIEFSRTFLSFDGTGLFYRAWIPRAGCKRALLLFHRGHEHSGRWEETVRALGLEDVAVFAWDARGHGQSPGERGRAPNMGVLARDMEAFVQHIAGEHGIGTEEMVVLAHSVGAVIAATWVHDYAPKLAGLILGTPAFRVKLYVPFALPLLRWKEKLFSGGIVKSYVKATMLTHDAEQAAAYEKDPMIFRQISVNVLLDLHDTSTRLLADAAAIRTPTLILGAGSDWVVKNSAVKAFFERLSSPHKRLEMLPGFYHAIFHEQWRGIVIQKVKEFISECFAIKPSAEALMEADREGFTKDEFDRLQKPSGNPIWSVTRVALKTIGRSSHGIRLGWRSGFDSGRTLDYVYENKPAGVTFLGRMIDRAYLNSIGWRGIRVRRENLQKVISAAIDELQLDGRPVRIVDIASGPGRYVLETVRELEGAAEVLLRDYKEENLEAARELAGNYGLKNVTVTFGDAFDRDSLAAITPKRTIGIVSGLYELIPSNEPVIRSLAGLAEAIEPGGYLVYTNQPWHPQVEFIARVLRNREGKRWIMRRRSQAEMDELVRRAGFQKVWQETDRWGIFTVALARRVELE